jgi:hypothetical protein
LYDQFIMQYAAMQENIVRTADAKSAAGISAAD